MDAAVRNKLIQNGIEDIQRETDSEFMKSTIILKLIEARNKELQFNKELASREDAIFDNDFLDGL